MEKTTILDKIAKLLNKAESAQKMGSLAEAEAFSAKANELLLLHNLERSDIKTEGDKFREWLFSDYIKVKTKTNFKFYKNLIAVICLHNLCGSTYAPYENAFRVYGEGANVQLVIWLYNFLSTAIMRICNTEWKRMVTNGMDKRYRSRFYKSFLFGCAMGINQKLKQSQESSYLYDKIQALIKVNEADLNIFVKQKIPEIRDGRKRASSVDKSIYDYGKEIGSKLSIGKPISTTKAESKLIS